MLVPMKNAIDPAALRAWWWYRQGLDGSLAGAPAALVLERAGWARSVGGASPYLTLFARAGIPRPAADAAVAALEIHELPAARGCTYVVPARDFALALLAGRGSNREMATARKLGVTEAEIDRLCTAVLDALAQGPLDPAEIKQAVGPASRDLGPQGAKKGLASTLPVALERLQSEGEIRRVPTNGRLDQQRYRYARWQPGPLRGVSMTPEEVHVELAKRFFRWAGPARLCDFQWFSGLGVKAAKAAIDALGLAVLPGDEERLLFPEDVQALASFCPPRDPQYALVSSLDAISLLRRDLASLLDPRDASRRAVTPKGTGELGGLADLPSHAILDRGRLIGLWEYDAEGGCIAWCSFGVKDEALQAAVARTEAYVKNDLGDARSFSLDSPKSRAPRVAALRTAAQR